MIVPSNAFLIEERNFLDLYISDLNISGVNLSKFKITFDNGANFIDLPASSYVDFINGGYVRIGIPDDTFMNDLSSRSLNDKRAAKLYLQNNAYIDSEGDVWGDEWYDLYFIANNITTTQQYRKYFDNKYWLYLPNYISIGGGELPCYSNFNMMGFGGETSVNNTTLYIPFSIYRVDDVLCEFNEDFSDISDWAINSSTITTSSDSEKTIISNAEKGDSITKPSGMDLSDVNGKPKVLHIKLIGHKISGDADTYFSLSIGGETIKVQDIYDPNTNTRTVNKDIDAFIKVSDPNDTNVTISFHSTLSTHLGFEFYDLKIKAFEYITLTQTKISNISFGNLYFKHYNDEPDTYIHFYNTKVKDIRSLEALNVASGSELLKTIFTRSTFLASGTKLSIFNTSLTITASNIVNMYLGYVNDAYISYSNILGGKIKSSRYKFFNCYSTGSIGNTIDNDNSLGLTNSTLEESQEGFDWNGQNLIVGKEWSDEYQPITSRIPTSHCIPVGAFQQEVATPILINNATLSDDYTVVLELNQELVSGKTYTLIINNVMDTEGNVIDKDYTVRYTVP